MRQSSKALVAAIMAALVAAPAPAWSQQNLLVEGPGNLKVSVLQGENAINSIKMKTATQPAVEVRDEQDKPVAGAEVVFQLPAAGPGGVFHGWMRTQTTRTNEQGQATASGLTPNEDEGRFNIKVTATQGKKTGSVIIAQSNARNGTPGQQAGKSRRGLWILVGVIAAAAIIGGVAAASGDDSSGSSTNPVTISAGPVTVGGPR